MILINLPAQACRNPIKFTIPTQEEALKAADLVARGYLIAIERGKYFDYKYTFEMRKIWKGSFKESRIVFEMQHSTCSRYRGPFEIDPEGKKDGVILYLKKNLKVWNVVRIIPNEDGPDSLKKEMDLLKSGG